MTKSKSKIKGIFKGVALGFAFVLCSAFFPVDAVKSLAASWSGTSETEANSHRIEVNGEAGIQNSSSTVVKGDNFTIPQGEYYAGSTAHVIGTTPSGDITTSKVEIIYKGTNDVVRTIENQTSFTNVSFEASMLGTYVIRYTVVDNEIEYSYDYEVECEAGEATFEFLDNEPNIIPSVYDKQLVQSRLDAGLMTSSNVVIPLPTVNDEDGQAILTSADSEYYTIDRSSYPTGEGDTENKNCFVYISLTSGNDSITLHQDAKTGEFYIAGTDLLENAEDGTEFKITYSFYQVRSNGNATFIASTSTTFTVEDEYYYNTSEEEEGDAGYSLSTSWSTSVPDSAVVGVEVTLPSVTATTRTSNSPANEEVEVYYKVEVIKMDEDNRYTIPANDVITEDFTFKATEEGSYRITYTVTDFYGNTADTSNTTFYITNVRDTQQANVYLYDAAMAEADRVDENGDYIDVTYKLKTQTIARNIVMYAIAGKDNMVEADEITLRREIRDASSVVRFNVTEQKYNNYNLIFAPGPTSSTSTMDDIYLQIVQDNYDIYRQMILDNEADDNAENDLSPAVAADIKTWLLGHNYLIVTTTWNQDPTGEVIVDGEPAENDETAIGEMMEAGFAYVKPTSSNGYTFSAQNYTFYYYANDGMNNNTERAQNYTVRLADEVSDASVPSLTFSTDLQSSYLPGETIEFSVASASDTVDSRIETVTAYRFLNSDGETVTNSDTTKTLRYVIPSSASYNQKDANKWYVTSRDEATGYVTSTGWFYDKSASSYSINLTDAPEGAVSVEIFAYAIDDYGNIGFYNRVISISTAVDQDMPTLQSITNAPDPIRENQSYEAPDTISLPLIKFSDVNPEFMHAKVSIYKIASDGSKSIVQSSNMQTRVDSYRGMYTVDAGNFTASTQGTYQAVVTVQDSANHTVTLYFTYYVGGEGYVEDPEIANITTEPLEVLIDTELYLEPPTISVSDTENYGYIGLDSNDDSFTSTYYTTTISSSSHSNYKLDQYYFTGEAAGVYKLQYHVFLMRYRLDALLPGGATDENAGIYLDEAGKLKYKEATSTGTSYYVLFEEVYDEDGEENNTNVIDYTVTLNTDIYGNGTTLADLGVYNSIEALLEAYSVNTFAFTSLPQTITVSDIEIEVSIDDEVYEKTQYSNIPEDDAEIVRLPIVKPQPQIKGEGEVNYEDSYVSITCLSGPSQTTIARISLEDWEEAVNESNSNDLEVVGESIFLKLARNGEYRIRYSIQGMNHLGQNVGDPEVIEYTISNGDVTDPEITFEDNFINDTYNLGDTLILNMAGLQVSDNVTTDTDYLLSTMSISLATPDGTTVPLNDEGDGDVISYEYTLNVAGDYTLTVTVKDEAGNDVSRSVSFTVSTNETEPVSVQEVLGGVLIGLSVAVLAGVVIYFVVSKVKLDKKEKGYKVDSKNDKNKE